MPNVPCLHSGLPPLAPSIWRPGLPNRSAEKGGAWAFTHLYPAFPWMEDQSARYSCSHISRRPQPYVCVQCSYVGEAWDFRLTLPTGEVYCYECTVKGAQ